MKMVRPQQPAWLKHNYKKWGKRFKKKLGDPAKSNDFVWATHNGEKINTKLLPVLRNATKKHCAFCDDKIQKGTIEHFRPTSKYPLLAYVWQNLFPSCSECQEKNNEFDKNLLKPDREDYEFFRYFIYNPFTGEILVSPKASTDDKIRAETCIKIYRLNRAELIEDRMDCYEYYKDVADEKRPFRFIFTRPTK